MTACQASIEKYTSSVEFDVQLCLAKLALIPGGAEECWSLGVPGERFVLRQGFLGDPAQIVVEDASGSPIWMAYSPVPAGRSLTVPGTQFHYGDGLRIPDAQAVLHSDGNFVLYETVNGLWQPTWSTDTWTTCTGYLASFQADGNLVVGQPGTPCLWAAGPGPNATVLRLHRDATGAAKLSIYNAEGQVLWQVP